MTSFVGIEHPRGGILELRQCVAKDQFHTSNGAVAMLGDDDLGHILFDGILLILIVDDELAAEAEGRRRGQRLSQRGRVRGPVSWAARAHDGPPRPLQADPGGRGILARRRAQASAAKGLRDRMGGPRRLSQPTCTASRKPSGGTTGASAPSSTCSPSHPSWARDWPCSTPKVASSAR